MRYSVVAVAVALFTIGSLITILIPAPARAGDLVTDLASFYATDFFVAPGSSVHEGHFQDSPGTSQSLVTLMSSIASQATTYPIGSSSGGFTFVRDDAGLPVPASQSFGPVLVERALTVGKGRYNFGLSYIHADYDDFQGQSLDGGTLKSVLQHEDTNGDNSTLVPEFEGDVIDTSVSLSLKRDETVFFFNYGVTDKIDIGIVLPWVQVDLDSTVNAGILRLATGSATLHAFTAVNPPGRCVIVDELNCTAVISNSESGLGDVALRGKMNVLSKEATALAVAVNLRVPTGDEKNLLGLGATQLQGQFIGSWSLVNDRVSPHFNLGYTASSGDYAVKPTGSAGDFKVEPPNEANLTLGSDFSLSGRVTVAGDVIGRRFFDAETIDVVSQEFEFDTDPTAGVALGSRTLNQMIPVKQDLDSTLGSVGVKVHVGKRILLNAAVLASLGGDDGLQDDLSFFVGIDFNR